VGYFSLNARHKDAEPLSRRVLEIAEAEPLLRRAIKILDASVGQEHRNTLACRFHLARLLISLVEQGKKGPRTLGESDRALISALQQFMQRQDETDPSRSRA